MLAIHKDDMERALPPHDATREELIEWGRQSERILLRAVLTAWSYDAAWKSRQRAICPQCERDTMCTVSSFIVSGSLSHERKVLRSMMVEPCDACMMRWPAWSERLPNFHPKMRTQRIARGIPGGRQG